MEEDNERYVDVGLVLAIDGMKRNIKTLGQSRTLSIINSMGNAEETKLAYKKCFFLAVRELECVK